MPFAKSSLSLSGLNNEDGFVRAEEVLEDRESSESLHCLFSLSHSSQTGLQPHDRRGVRISGSQRGWEDCETTDLGHGWPGAVSVGGLGSHGERESGGRREVRGEKMGERERGVQSLGDTIIARRH